MSTAAEDFVRRSREAQGLPPTIECETTLDRVAALLTVGQTDREVTAHAS